MNLKKKRPKIVVEEITETSVVFEGSTNCPECGSLMNITRHGSYEEADCVGCGYTEASNLTRPL